MLFMRENNFVCIYFRKACVLFAVLTLFCCNNSNQNNEENKVKPKIDKSDYTHIDIDITGDWYLYGLEIRTINQISEYRRKLSRSYSFSYSQKDSCTISFSQNNELIYENQVIGYWETINSSGRFLFLSDVLNDSLRSPIPMNSGYSLLKKNNIYLNLIKIYGVKTNEPKIQISYIFRRPIGFDGKITIIP